MRRSICFVALLLVSPSVAPVPSSASAQADANFVDALYSDFLFRDPTSAESNSAVAWLAGGGSRASIVNAVIGGNEFASLWAYGVYDRYLDRYPDNVELSAAQAQAGAGNYTGPEVAAMASSEFYAGAGSSATGFVTEVYRRALDREPDPSGLAYWVGKLGSGTSRASVAASFIRLGESARKRVGGAGVGQPCSFTELSEPAAISAGSYCIVLDRSADQSGFDHWVAQMTGSGQMPTLWRQMASSNEYYNSAQ